MAEERLKVAVQKSGRLTDNSLELLAKCGLTYTRGRDQLVCFGENMPLDVLLVRDDDIVDLVQEGIADLGFCGLNVVEEKCIGLAEQGRTALCTREQSLDFGHCRLSVAVPVESRYEGPTSLAGKAIATTYPRMLTRWLARHEVKARVVTLSGAVEIAPRLGRADVICDLVASGDTLRANGLREVDVIYESQTVVIKTPVPLSPEKGRLASRMLTRIAGVQQVKESKYIMLHAPRAALARIRELLPGCESPTVLPLDGQTDKIAVHAVCRETVFWETLEELKAAGASAVLVLPVEKMLP